MDPEDAVQLGAPQGAAPEGILGILSVEAELVQPRPFLAVFPDPNDLGVASLIRICPAGDDKIVRLTGEKAAPDVIKVAFQVEGRQQPKIAVIALHYDLPVDILDADKVLPVQVKIGAHRL